jgi:dTDP-4-dehydrorhamnose reductase
MKSILVTGSNGQLGNEIKLLSKEFQSFSFHFHDIDTLDITNRGELEEVIKSIQPDYIVNCAAYTAVDKAESDSYKAYLINAQASRYLFELSQKLKFKIIHISTDYVFDGTLSRPYIETDLTNPQSVYGKTKLEGEKYYYNYKKAIVIRTSWLYSVYGNNFVKTMRRLGNEKSELGVVFDQVGSPTNAADLADAILHIIKASSFVSGIYHYSNEGVCSWFDFATEIMRLSGLKCVVKPIESKDFPQTARRPNYSVFNKAKIKSVYKLQIPWWKDSLQKCIENLIASSTIQ